MVFPILICENNFHKIEKQVENLQKRERIFVYKFEINFYLCGQLLTKMILCDKIDIMIFILIGELIWLLQKNRW